MDNLINNAVKFTLSGHVVLRLEAGQQYGDTVSLIFRWSIPGSVLHPSIYPGFSNPTFVPQIS
ncbi:hypothetical protein DMB90_10865 [Raoultella planticola]|uniref:Uncharacterized protein n=1 Tax=Raoultella planticola TaxID=575 RepID=A0A5P6A9R1_RAOPL|nr:hypothetical protein DMB90_10865 [Raoultella planticola]